MRPTLRSSAQPEEQSRRHQETKDHSGNDRALSPRRRRWSDRHRIGHWGRRSCRLRCRLGHGCGRGRLCFRRRRRRLLEQLWFARRARQCISPRVHRPLRGGSIEPHPSEPLDEGLLRDGCFRVQESRRDPLLGSPDEQKDLLVGDWAQLTQEPVEPLRVASDLRASLTDHDLQVLGDRFIHGALPTGLRGADPAEATAIGDRL